MVICFEQDQITRASVGIVVYIVRTLIIFYWVVVVVINPEKLLTFSRQRFCYVRDFSSTYTSQKIMDGTDIDT